MDVVERLARSIAPFVILRSIFDLRVGVPSEPIEAQVVHQFFELLEPDRFNQITIGVIVICLRNILLGFGRGEDNDGNGFELVVFFDGA